VAERVGMKFSQLAFIVTDDCNFNCSYCPQMKEKKYMKHSTIEKAIAFFYPFLKEETSISFCGGEPLLAFDKIKHAVSLLLEKNKGGEKKFSFFLTTNGSLVTDEMLEFFDGHHFDVLLSFDGLAQDIRKPGSLVPTRELIRRIQGNTYPDITFSTNSVFSPATINYLSASLKYIIETGVTDLDFELAVNMPWYDAVLGALEQELTSLTDFLVSYYRQYGTIPVRNFRRKTPRTKNKKKLPCFICTAGRNRIAISPGELVWGCSLFHDYLKNKKDMPYFHNYSFGKLDDFIKNHETIYPRVLINHAFLSQDCFFVGEQPCLLCDEIGNCRVCPVAAAYTTSTIGEASPWVCGINGIQKKEKNRFQEEIDNLNI
jgi:sulfatase maturation enzyme AslB (radical SAM superfamily)